MVSQQKVLVVGAGPVGALAALYAAERGDQVEVYELRGDPRDAATVPLNFTKSINLALSERGINAMRHAQSHLLDNIMKETIPMEGRMIHGKDKLGKIYEAAQAYDVHGRHINAVDRWELNKSLLDALDDMPNVTFHFMQKLTGADLRKKRAWFEEQRSSKAAEKETGQQDKSKADGKPSATPGTDPTPSGQTVVNHKRLPEVEIDFDLLIGADGAHSAVRYHLMKYARMSYEQTYIDTLWCEFHIAPDADGDFAMSPNHLHIWPGTEFMFIAIPSLDKSFTCTLFAPQSTFDTLRASSDLESSLPAFFDKHFPGVSNFIEPADLIHQFETNPALPLISIKCSPYHFKDAAVILGDAAHAMVPFYGQGMNAGLEDVRVLFEHFDQHGLYSPPEDEDATSHEPSGRASTDAATAAAAAKRSADSAAASTRARALESYTRQRAPDAAAINDLALANYWEMRAGVTSPVYRLRKTFEETVSRLFPNKDWATQYARVSFGNERYSEVEHAIKRQGQLEVYGVVGVLGVTLAVGVAAWFRWKR